MKENKMNDAKDRNRKLAMLGGLGLGLALLGRKRRWRRYAMGQMMGGGFGSGRWGRFGYGHGGYGGPQQPITLPAFIEAALEAGGFKVMVAADGSSALRLASSLHPDLVVLDLGLPGMDGLDVTRSLRRNGALPIIMLTARADESDKLVGLELGADDYLTKPF